MISPLRIISVILLFPMVFSGLSAGHYIFTSKKYRKKGFEFLLLTILLGIVEFILIALEG